MPAIGSCGCGTAGSPARRSDRHESRDHLREPLGINARHRRAHRHQAGRRRPGCRAWSSRAARRVARRRRVRHRQRRLRPALDEAGVRSRTAQPLWLFSVGPIGRWATSTNPIEPTEIARIRRSLRPIDHRVFAGALDRDKLNSSDLGRVERFVSRRFMPEGDFRDWPGIDLWADGIARRMCGG